MIMIYQRLDANATEFCAYDTMPEQTALTIEGYMNNDNNTMSKME